MEIKPAQEKKEPKPVKAVEYFKAKLEFETTPHQLKNKLDKNYVYLLDVRDRESFGKEHIAGAHNIPMAELPQNYDVGNTEKIEQRHCRK